MFESILDATDSSVNTFVFQAWVAFNAAANNWITGMMVLFVAILGYLILIGRVNVTLAELFPRFLKLIFVYVLVTNIGLLVTLVFNLFTNVPESIATTLLQAVGGVNSASINQSIDSVFDRGMLVAGRLFEEAGLRNLTPALFGGVVVLVTMLVVGFVTFLLMLAKLAVAILLGVAPFFILLYLFDSTRSIFEGWLRQTISFALIPVITYSLLLLIISILDTAATTMLAASDSSLTSLSSLAPYLLVMVASFLLATQILGIASGIGGGLQLSTLGAFGRSISAATAPGRAAGAAASAAVWNRTGGRLADRFSGSAARQIKAYEGTTPPTSRPGALARSTPKTPNSQPPKPQGDKT